MDEEIMSQRLEDVIRFFRNRIRDDLDVRVVRALEDGRHVFLHVLLSRKNGSFKRVAACLFETEIDGSIIEYRVITAAWQDNSPSGHGMIDGETGIRDIESTGANKDVVRNFISDVLQKGNVRNLSKYISAREFIQHNLILKDGIAALAGFLDSMKGRGETFRYEKVYKIIGQGNFVVSLCAVRSGEENLRVFDIFRLDEGKIVEHWANTETLTP
jgi:predicted SnoaL-like aldol condensation-catalyzing enzyme